jgi:hypothetical protein
MRLWLCLAFTPFIPAGLFMFGIGLNNGSHWLLPAFGLGVSACGVVPASSAALTYLTDAYTDVRFLSNFPFYANVDHATDMNVLSDYCGFSCWCHVHSQSHLYYVCFCPPALVRPCRLDMVLCDIWLDCGSDNAWESYFHLLWEDLPGQSYRQISSF